MRKLPIDDFIPEILSTIKGSPNLILQAEPGAGKTTRLPAALAKIALKKVLVLEPRRVAALSAATFIAEEQGWQLGQEVGYQVRFENKTSAQTKLTFITEALLAKKLIQDPKLNDYEYIVLDEFHERSVHVDLALGLLKELQEMDRPDLKIIIMSATIETESLKTFLSDSKVIFVPGQKFANTISLQKTPLSLKADDSYLQTIADKVKSVSHNKDCRDILVFLPGVPEIERTYSKLISWAQAEQKSLLRLHGSLPIADQQFVLRPQEMQKIILATNIAESSLTIDGVNTVIDSGLAKKMRLNSKTGFTELNMSRISKASATQRAGRAARQMPGYVHRLWNQMDEQSMSEFDLPEIQSTDLTESLLILSSLGISNFHSFSWFEVPDKDRLDLAEKQLKQWQAIDINNRITELGQKMILLPLHPRLARLMLAAQHYQALTLGAELCTILGERDSLKSISLESPDENDLLEKWRILEKSLKQKPHLKRSIEQILRHFKNDRNSDAKEHTEKNLIDLIPKILFPSYSDRLCRRRRPMDENAQMVEGKGVRLSPKSSVKTSEFFLALDIIDNSLTQDALISAAVGLSKDWVLQQINEDLNQTDEIEFDNKSLKFTKSKKKFYKGLLIEEAQPQPLSAQEQQTLLPKMAVQRWTEILQKNEKLQSWWTRYLFYCQKTNTESFTQNNLVNIFETALFGEKNLEVLFSKDLIYFFEQHLPSGIAQSFNGLCPNSIKVPSGSEYRIHYHLDKNPSLEVRLQEVFGWSKTPKIWNETIPITLHLLGPNYRPTQVTQDLESFWKNGYPEVRKELRTRYPKHSWPDDPLTAPAVSRGGIKKL